MTRLRAVLRRTAGLGVLLFVVLQTAGCYYVQAIRGHNELMSRRRPVGEVIEDQTSPQALRDKLLVASEARDFAVTDLYLPDNDSYRTFADLERDYVVWNIFAAPEFSLAPKTWCYPVAGCVAYRGYFSRVAAEKQGKKLSFKGYDVAMAGVPAYSTLGRFPDPLLNTMMRWSDVDLVSTVFHELAHQKLYIKGDSAFNESFATAVADIGIERWLTKTGELDRLKVYYERKHLRRDVNELVVLAREELGRLYDEPIGVDDMRRQKRQILDRLSASAQSVIDARGGGARNWLAPPLNNARLISQSLYEGRVAAFRSILGECDDDLMCFYFRATELAALPHEDRWQRLDALAD